MSEDDCDCEACGGGGYFRKGLGFGYPPCCSLRFAWDLRFGRDPYQRRGVRFTGKLSEEAGLDSYVPCRIFHRSHLPHEVWEKASHQLRSLGRNDLIADLATLTIE